MGKNSSTKIAMLLSDTDKNIAMKIQNLLLAAKNINHVIIGSFQPYSFDLPGSEM